MSESSGKYLLNADTLLFEQKEGAPRHTFLKILMLLAVSTALAVLYIYLYPSVFGPDLPKTAVLKRHNARWVSRIEVLRRDLLTLDEALEGLKGRDENLYRAIFGLGSIPDQVRSSGLGGRSRYSWAEGVGHGSSLVQTAKMSDYLIKKAYIQSKSYDEVESIAKRAGDMASCIPAIPPFEPGTYTLTSPFGYRSDPINGSPKLHSGMDFACPPGNPIYATGSGRIESVKNEFTGYGNSIMIDHGFGYKSRYAHMRDIYVVEGMEIRRGDLLGTSGNSGRVTGPHLHYEVYYKGSAVNPYNFMDLSMSVDEYSALTEARSEDSKANLGRGRVKLK